MLNATTKIPHSSQKNPTRYMILSISESYVGLFLSYSIHDIFRKCYLWPWDQSHWNSNSSKNFSSCTEAINLKNFKPTWAAELWHHVTSQSYFYSENTDCKECYLCINKSVKSSVTQPELLKYGILNITFLPPKQTKCPIWNQLHLTITTNESQM